MSPLCQIAVAALAYFLGGISPGYWLVRVRTGRDVRDQGSGGTGATNVGRVLGSGGFAIVLVLDIAKGAAAILVPYALGADLLIQHVCLLFVVAGHVWPVALRFRGGKGVGPLLGALLVLHPLLLAPGAILTLAVRPFVRFTIAGLVGLATVPFTLWLDTRDIRFTAIVSTAYAIVLFAHRQHLKDWRRGSRFHPQPQERT